MVSALGQLRQCARILDDVEVVDLEVFCEPA